MDISRFIDLHVHVGPELLPRKFTVPTLVAAETGKIAGMALKNHFYSTVPVIKTVKANDLELIGSVTLNSYIGGLNPDVVSGMAKLSEKPIIVWFPTISADNFLKQSKYEIPSEWSGGKFKSRLSAGVKGIKIINEDGSLAKDAKNVLESVKENSSIVATGHVSWQEAKVLAEEAVKMGIKKIIVTHPIYQLIDMPIDVQKELAQNEGVYIEQNYAMHLIDGIPIEKIAAQIKAIKPENCIISSDMGQVNSPSPSEAMKIFTDVLKQEGLTEEELRIMGEVNPRKLLE